MGSRAFEADGDAFDGFVAARYAAVLRAACLIAADPHDAMDLLHDSLAQVYARRHAIRDPGATEGYGRRTMRGTHVSRWRRVRREVPTGVLPDWSTEQSQRDPVVEAALRALPPRQRAAVVLRYYLDLSTARVTHELGCSQATAKTHLARALKTLRVELAHGREDEVDHDA
ncbi:SigE family RNA polymerase sigma factor [Kitasatospora sp. NPDC058965]|uniref:SigE family RNA polymerase sigma factor n=1 Tax=Kitasatospora sp. NPDC058965 TaxID=3346682 RepID=UPI0036C107B8